MNKQATDTTDGGAVKRLAAEDAVPVRNEFLRSGPQKTNASGQRHEPYAEPASARQEGGDHYRRLSIQPWDAMEAWMTREEFIGFLLGNVIKYAARARLKGGVSDLKKLRHYADKLIETLEVSA